jgi:hypothetical protein
VREFPWHWGAWQVCMPHQELPKHFDWATVALPRIQPDPSIGIVLGYLKAIFLS